MWSVKILPNSMWLPIVFVNDLTDLLVLVGQSTVTERVLSPYLNYSTIKVPLNKQDSLVVL